MRVIGYFNPKLEMQVVKQRWGQINDKISRRGGELRES